MEDAAYTIDFGEQGGGEQQFDTPEEVIGYVDRQKQAWSALATNPQKSPYSPIVQAWNSLRTRPNANQLPTNDPKQIAGNIASQASSAACIRADSKAGLIIQGIFEDLGPDVTAWAAAYAVKGRGSDQLHENQYRTHVGQQGMFHFETRMAGLDAAGAATARTAAKTLAAQLRRERNEQSKQYAEHRDEHVAAVQRLTDLLARREQDAEALNAKFGEEWQAQSEKIDAAWEAIANAFTENLRIEAPVKLWRNRAKEHETRSRNFGIASTTMAVAGFVVAIIAALAAYDFARWLFADAWIGAKVSTGELRPTLHFELILTSALMLLYLTIFVWGLRLMIRNYMTERHLAIDARARAAMAETYLALIKDSAAGEQDRAIILGSLFRPVVDGIVKDDAMPILSPAALAASLVTGGKAS